VLSVPVSAAPVAVRLPGIAVDNAAEPPERLRDFQVLLFEFRDTRLGPNGLRLFFEGS
jgi:hypothetical protein